MNPFVDDRAIQVLAASLSAHSLVIIRSQRVLERAAFHAVDHPLKVCS